MQEAVLPQGKANVDKAWFASQMKERNLTVRRMAGRMNMHYSALSRTLNGERRMQVDEIRKIAEIFGQPVSEVWAHLGSPMSRQNAGDTGHSPGLMEGQVDFEMATDMNGNSEEYIVPPRDADPLFGCMAGTLTLLPDVDYTAPADPDWGKVYDD
jgi:transcriptional regulator with XRE-family HTH domain